MGMGWIHGVGGGFCQVSTGSKLTHHLPVESVEPSGTNKCMHTASRQQSTPSFCLHLKVEWVKEAKYSYETQSSQR